MRTGLAFLAGVVGGAVAAAAMFLAREFGMTEMNWPMILGSIFTGNTSAATWFLGLILHLGVSGLIALAYAVAFEATGRSTWWLGMVLGGAHALLGGFLMWWVPVLNPIMPETLSAPGPFGFGYGTAAGMAFILLHLLYGAIVGRIYEPVRGRALPKPVAEPQREEEAVGAGAEHRRWQ